MRMSFSRNLVIVAATVITVFSDCGPDDTSLRCYKFVNIAGTNAFASNYCKNLGGTLATVDNAFINSYITSTAAQKFGKTNGNFWIGLHFDGKAYKWDDGTAVGYTNWASGFPFENINSVAIQLANGRWQTVSESNSLPFVCSYPSGDTTQDPSTVATSTEPFVPVSTPRTNCLSPFTLLNGRCLAVVRFKTFPDVSNDTLQQEIATCKSVGGTTLASIHSTEENEFVKSLIGQQLGGNTFATIGLYNPDVGNVVGKWAWVDNSTLDYHNFKAGHPLYYETITQLYETTGEWETYFFTDPETGGVVCTV